MTILSGLLGLAALAMMAALAVLAVRRERDIRHNAPGATRRGAAAQGHVGDPARTPGRPLSEEV
ncbi:hypothetical protein [Actinomadura sp. BRA 177]|uniref:hypothetical protein n=1 Tax=Actinomadura sp. BRA 177 TaxID=2745202 RepID=UPI00159592FB|nr:hypothetical protein [Actinomadura sp. BRA 177]NVI87042.1 hypothetical protein [Actinomadura sp. BRA 177]